MTHNSNVFSSILVERFARWFDVNFYMFCLADLNVSRKRKDFGAMELLWRVAELNLFILRLRRNWLISGIDKMFDCILMIMCFFISTLCYVFWRVWSVLNMRHEFNSMIPVILAWFYVTRQMYRCIIYTACLWLPRSRVGVWMGEAVNTVVYDSIFIFSKGFG